MTRSRMRGKITHFLSEGETYNPWAKTVTKRQKFNDDDRTEMLENSKPGSKRSEDSDDSDDSDEEDDLQL